MFRQPRETEPDMIASKLSQILEPLQFFPWAEAALDYLGVPIVTGVYTIVVRDDDYLAVCQKLEDAGYTKTAPDRSLDPEELAGLPDPEDVVWQLSRGFKRVDELTTLFKRPEHDRISTNHVMVAPNSFAHIPLNGATSDSCVDTAVVGAANYETYNNIVYPLESALVESFVKAALDDEYERPYPTWGGLLECWVCHMSLYLEVNNDILDHCDDARVVEWYSAKFGRIREATIGPMDRRITKRLGSGREMPVDTRGNLLPK